MSSGFIKNNGELVHFSVNYPIIYHEDCVSINFNPFIQRNELSEICESNFISIT